MSFPESENKSKAALEAENPFVNEPAISGYDPDAPNWRNLFNAVTGNMTTNGIERYREKIYAQKEEADIKKCNEWRDWNFNYSPTVIFLKQKIEELNGELGPMNVICKRCIGRQDDKGVWRRQGGGFSPDHGILICANHIKTKKEMEDTMAHEMVHAWDHLRWKVDWSDLRHAACTEIRASSLSGECRFMREVWGKGNWALTQQHQNCVRRRAINSVMLRPNCKDDVQATKVVNEVWDSCFTDTRPFDTIYR